MKRGTKRQTTNADFRTVQTYAAYLKDGTLAYVSRLAPLDESGSQVDFNAERIEVVARRRNEDKVQAAFTLKRVPHDAPFPPDVGEQSDAFRDYDTYKREHALRKAHEKFVNALPDQFSQIETTGD